MFRSIFVKQQQAMLCNILLSKACPSGLMRMAGMSTNILDIRQQLMQYKGGSVDLDLDTRSGLGVMTLKNAEKMNALSGQMMVELADRVTELESWSDGRAVIFMGASNTFCSGGDLETVKALHDPEHGFRMSYMMQDTMNRFWTLPQVTVALIQGRALGGGAELTTACDFRIMTSSAKVGFVQARMGVTTGWGGGTRLVKLLGKSKALKLLCSGKLLDANSCKDIGLVDQVLGDTPDVLSDVKSLMLNEYCIADCSIIQAMKNVVNGACDHNVNSALENERNVFRAIWGGPVQQAALNRNIKHK